MTPTGPTPIPRETGAASMASPLDVARAIYREISLYAPDRTPCALDLSDNTNAWGIPPAAEQAIRETALSSVTRYPNLYSRGPKEALATYLGVTADMIVTGCGSDDVLDSAIRAVGEPGEQVAHPDPSFHMVPIFARMNGLEPIAVPLTAAYDADAERFVATGARIMYLCSPNNPTGAAFSRPAIEYIVEHAPGIVVVDEAYAEYAGTTVVDLLARSERLLVVRTLSKAFGLAGLRIGYAAGAPALVAAVEKSRGPYKVNAVADRAAVAALTDGRVWVAEMVAAAVGNRSRLLERLRAMGLSPLPSAANFVLVPVSDARAITTAMRARGVAVRPFVALPGIGDALRITLGPWELIERVLAALAEVLATLPPAPRR